MKARKSETLSDAEDKKFENFMSNFQNENKSFNFQDFGWHSPRSDIGDKDIVSEGYGENESIQLRFSHDFSTMQDKVKSTLTNGSDSTAYLLQIIEELYKQYDRSLEEVKKDKEDLQQQVRACLRNLICTLLHRFEYIRDQLIAEHSVYFQYSLLLK